MKYFAEVNYHVYDDNEKCKEQYYESFESDDLEQIKRFFKRIEREVIFTHHRNIYFNFSYEFTDDDYFKNFVTKEYKYL